MVTNNQTNSQRVTPVILLKTKTMMAMDSLMLMKSPVTLIHKTQTLRHRTWMAMQHVTHLTMISTVTEYQTMRKATAAITLETAMN